MLLDESSGVFDIAFEVWTISIHCDIALVNILQAGLSEWWLKMTSLRTL